jgi:NhaP-type Na+/H+ or K+/H+ antiporter
LISPIDLVAATALLDPNLASETLKTTVAGVNPYKASILAKTYVVVLFSVVVQATA